MRVKTNQEGRTKDVAITEVTAENYIVPEKEKGMYHCIIEVRKFDSETGKRLSVPRIQKFGKKAFENTVCDGLKKQGYTITILHDPNEYLKERAKLDAQRAEEAEKKRYEAEKEKMRAEILAELAEQKKAEGEKAEAPKRGRGANKPAEANAPEAGATEKEEVAEGEKAEQA